MQAFTNDVVETWLYRPSGISAEKAVIKELEVRKGIGTEKTQG